MTTVTLQFTSLASLAAFWKQVVTNRGYVIIVRHLTLRCRLSNDELERALNEFNASMLGNHE